MHKKLFALLATAAVGLTLTSCGGGGGGGGGAEAPSTGDDTVSTSLPASLSGKSMTFVAGNGGYDKYVFSGGTVTNTFANDASGASSTVYTGSYTYSPITSRDASLTMELESESRNNKYEYNLTLSVNPSTGEVTASGTRAHYQLYAAGGQSIYVQVGNDASVNWTDVRFE